MVDFIRPGGVRRLWIEPKLRDVVRSTQRTCSVHIPRFFSHRSGSVHSRRKLESCSNYGANNNARTVVLCGGGELRFRNPRKVEKMRCIFEVLNALFFGGCTMFFCFHCVLVRVLYRNRQSEIGSVMLRFLPCFFVQCGQQVPLARQCCVFPMCSVWKMAIGPIKSTQRRFAVRTRH